MPLPLPSRLVLPALAAALAAASAPLPAFASAPSSVAGHGVATATATAVAAPAVRQQPVPAVTGRAGGVVADTGTRSVRDFRMLGVEWAAGTGVALEARVRTASGWTSWEPLVTSHDGPVTSTARTDPLWVDHADGYQVRARGDRLPDGLHVLLVDPGADGTAPSPASAPSPADGPSLATTPSLATARTTAAGTTTTTATSAPLAAGNVPAPDVVTRAEWGADESRTTTCSAGTYGSTVQMTFVHHTAHTTNGPNDYTEADAPSIVRSIYLYDTSGASPYCDLSYNALVDRYGNIYEGRRGGLDLPVLGGHTAGHNTNTFGVAMIGTFQGTDPGAVPPAVAVDALSGLLAWKLALNYRDPLGTAVLAADPDTTYPVISGHRDSSTASTLCPGDNLYPLLPQVRQDVATRIGTYGSPIYRKWQDLGGESGFVGSPFRGETASGSATYAQFGGAELWWTSGTGAHEVHGAIRTEYRRFSARDNRLGVPTTDQVSGRRTGAVYNAFQGGRIYASSRTGARTLYGPVLSRYLALGADGSRLRLPTTGVKSGKRAGATFVAFQGGRIYSSSRTGARPVWGPILKRYQRLGYDASRLRLPTRAEEAVRGGTLQRFQGGRIRWYRSSNTTKVFYS